MFDFVSTFIDLDADILVVTFLYEVLIGIMQNLEGKQKSGKIEE